MAALMVSHNPDDASALNAAEITLPLSQLRLCGDARIVLCSRPDVSDHAGGSASLCVAMFPGR